MAAGAARKLAAIMFTDTVGYSALAQRNEALALDLSAEHQGRLRPIFLQHGGREIKTTGDGFLVEFGSALQAVRCVIAIQTALVEQNASAAFDRRIQVCIGLHLGDVEVRDGDVFGDGVNIAARVEAIARDPGYALAYLGLGYYYWAAVDYPMPGSEALPRAREAAERSLQLDPSLAEAHTWLAAVHWWYDRDYAAAEREFEAALAMQPELANTHTYYGWYLVTAGQVDRGLAELRRGVELDPLSPELNSLLGVNLYFARRYDKAIEQLRTTVTTDPDYWWAHLWLGRAYARAGKTSEAITELQAAQRRLETPELEAALGRVYADAGDRATATEILEHLRRRMHDEFVSASFLATVQIGLGQLDEAFAALAEADVQRSYYVPCWKVDPELDPLRSDARFAALLKKVGLEP